MGDGNGERVDQILQVQIGEVKSDVKDVSGRLDKHLIDCAKASAKLYRLVYIGMGMIIALAATGHPAAEKLLGLLWGAP